MARLVSVLVSIGVLSSSTFYAGDDFLSAEQEGDILSAAFHRKSRTVYYLLLLAAFACGLVGSAVTALVNVPVNQELATWDPTALPSGYEAFLRRWWAGHQVRLVAMLAGTCLVFAAMLARAGDRGQRVS